MSEVRDWFLPLELAGLSLPPSVWEVVVDKRDYLELFRACDYCGSLTKEWSACERCGGGIVCLRHGEVASFDKVACRECEKKTCRRCSVACSCEGCPEVTCRDCAPARLRPCSDCFKMTCLAHGGECTAARDCDRVFCADCRRAVGKRMGSRDGPASDWCCEITFGSHRQKRNDESFILDSSSIGADRARS